MSLKCIIFIMAAIPYFAFGQKEELMLMQQAIEQKDFAEHVKRQILFDLSETMYFTLPKDFDESGFTIKFCDNAMLKSEETPNEPILLVNFDFQKVNVKGSKARIKYTFYPFWKICDETGPSPSYSNGLFINVDVRFKKESGLWSISEAKIEDMDFDFSKGIPGYGCLNKHYIPF
ncbi:MAG: hypothetical protein ACK46O_00185 [Flavobacteriia bacterium]